MFADKIKEIWDYRELILAFVARDLKVRYRGSVLGFLWSFLDPLINAAVLWLIFTFIFARGISHFAVYLLAGIVVWNFFAASISQGAQVITANGSLIKKIKLPREVFPISVVVANLIHFFLTFLVLVLFIFITRVPINFTVWVYLPPFLLLLFIFNLGGAFLTSAISVYFRDFPFIIDSALKVLYFATPIFYSPDFIPEQFRRFYFANPLAATITAFRQIVLDGVAPDIVLPLILGISSFVAIVLGWWVFSRLERGFGEEI